MLGCKVHWKAETLQRTWAFKLRGALNRMLVLRPSERAQEIVTASSGNYGVETSLAAKIAGTAATVFVPLDSPRTKQEKIRRLRAEVMLSGRTYNEALDAALDWARTTGRIAVSSFEDPVVIEGQGTVALEILDALADVDDLLVPIVGGALLPAPSPP